MPTKPGSLTHTLLARAHSPASVTRIYGEKIQHRPLLLRASSPPPSADARAARRQTRRQKEKQRARALKPKPLSARARRRLCLYDLPRDGSQTYATFAPLHSLWLGYARELLGDDLFVGGQMAAAKLSSADFHGAEVEVVRSRCVSRVGVKGVVVKDSKFVFEVVTRKDKVKVIPKEGTVFRVEIPAAEEKRDGHVDAQGTAEEDTRQRMVVEVLGDQFLLRSTDRANKKFKQHYLENI